MEPLNCLVVDDTDIDRMVVEEYVQQQADLRLVGSYSNPLESMAALRRGDIHVLFLDIDMPVVNGINFFKKLDNPPVCVFITAYADFALEAFEVHAFDYLLKPIRKQRFEHMVIRLKELFEIQAKALHYDMHFENDSLTIKEGNTIARVCMHDIIFLEALTNYTKIVTANRKYITLSNLKNFIDKLPAEKFVRIHRSYAVAVDKIQSLENGILNLGQFTLPVGKTYRREINRFLIGKATE